MTSLALRGTKILAFMLIKKNSSISTPASITCMLYCFEIHIILRNMKLWCLERAQSRNT